MLDALVVAPHPDDAELGMGGTIVRLIGQGWSVGILDLTSGEPTPLGPPSAARPRRPRPTPRWGIPGGRTSDCPTGALSRP